MFSCGTALNIFHEYVAEGQYVGPSFIDLWLNQIGLLLAMLGYFLTRRRREPDGANDEVAEEEQGLKKRTGG